MTLRVAIVTNVVPNYRRGFYERLFARRDVHVEVFCQDELPGVNVQTIHADLGPRVHVVPFIGASGERLVIQRLPFRRLFAGDFDVVFVDGNPRQLSHVALASWREWRNRPTVLWAMARSYRKRQLPERIRLRWMRMFHHILTYMDADVAYLRDRGFVDQVIVAQNNGLDQRAIDAVVGGWDRQRLTAWRREQQLDGRRVVLSIARLTEKNRFDLFVDALPELCVAMPTLTWCIVGEGDTGASLREQVRARGLDGHVRFVGAVYEEELLAPWFLAAELIVHPGAIGLGLLHAFGYGRPVVTHNDFRSHGPEFAVFESGRTGFTFAPGDRSGLAAAVRQLLDDPEARASMGDRARQLTRTYNVDTMVERFVAIARCAGGKPRSG